MGRQRPSRRHASLVVLSQRISHSLLLLVLVLLLALTTRGVVDAQTSSTTTTFTQETVLSAASDVLLKLFEETGGLRWTSRTNWLQDEQVCNYQGIVCYTANDDSQQRIGHIKEINLADNHLVGVIPSQVFTDLPYLESLVLRDNPDLVVNLPTTTRNSASSSSSASLSFLRHLEISNTNTQSLTGIDTWFNTSLETLHINDLDMTGPIPNVIYQLSRLTGLYANNNHFSGVISPDGISNLQNLQELYLRNNDLSGSIPTTIGNLRSLRVLVLANNNALQGAIPTEIEECTELEILALERDNGNSNVVDMVDPGDGTTTSTTDEELDYTYIYGGTDVSDLGVGLTGPVPALANMPNLNLVSLQNHQLSGPLPSNFMSMAPANEILEVNLSNNAVTGSIPESLSSKNRVNLYVAGNKMSSLGDAYATSKCANIPNWMNGAVSSLGCNAIACPIGYYAPSVGRATTTNQGCTVCETSIYLGQTSCATSSTGAGTGTSGNGTSTTGSSTTAAVNQRAFLISFFNKMGGRYWRNSNNWLNPGSNECTWFGIECNNDTDGQVTHISLPNNGLTNTVPSDIFLLPELVALDFSSNSIAFSFEGIENAKKLQKLYLVQSDLDSIDGIGNLAKTNSIRQLALASNYLQSSPPEGLFDLTSLEELDISHNRFAGSLSSRIGQLTNLVRLEMFGNRFSGQLPEEIGNLVQLEEFMAAGNGFSGTLPTQLENLIKLKTLSLHQTTSPSEIGGNLLALPNLSQLTSLQLDGNALVGTLPSNMLQETSRGSDRIELLLSNNKLEGEIPSSWSGRFRQLVVDLSGNQISSFGSGICSQTSWMDGTVAAYQCNAILCPQGTFNEFGRQTSDGGDCRSCPQVQVLGSKICYSDDGTPQGPTTTSEKELAILKEFYTATHGYNWVKSDGWSTTDDYCSWYGVGCSNQRHVERIYMESNGLTGQPPTSLFDLTELEELTLKDNVISFSFDGIGKATKLSKLDLTGSSIDSVTGLDQGTSLLTLILDYNDLAGSFPTEFLQLGNLRYLSASFNKLEGRLPTDFTLLSMLESLTLYHNRLSGPLPAAIGSLENLKVLGLSENNFDGEIPLEFNNLVNLEMLAIQREGGTDVGNVGRYQGKSEDQGTGLTGPLPAFDKLTNLRELFLGVNSLSGEIPANFLGSLDNIAEAVIDITSNRLTGGLPASLARFERLSFYAAGNQLTLEVPSGLCLNDWMNGEVAMFECSAILCPPNTYNSNYGRQKSSESTCQSCESGKSTPYYGSFTCLSTEDKQVMSERVVLGDLYQALGGDGWRLKDYWLDPDISVCQWHGITCSADGSVESIHLMQNGLVGDVPSSIYELPYLKEINFASNSGITMTFDGIQDASRLEFLNVGETGLKSLEGVGQAPALSLLHAPGNDFNNVFPTAVLNIASLEVLDLSSNAVGSTLPSGISNLDNLIVFSCSKCGLTGQFPQFVGNMTQLEFLDLSFNDFNGPLPASIESLSNLKHLDLSSQASADNIGGLSGNLPSFVTATQLTEVYLQKNSFMGSIPSTFLSAMDGTVPVTVDLRSNKLNGTIPEALSKFQVADFYAADNMISVIPPTLCALQWNGKPSAETSCDYILCNTGGFNGIGRATIDLPCEICESADYLGTTSCGDAERDILQKMYFDLDGYEWNHADGWGSSSSVCTWYGVTCHPGDLLNGLVKSLDLRDNNLVGTLSERIWLLAQMTELDLSDNTALVVPNFARVADASSLQNLKLSKTQVQSLTGIGSANSLISFHCTSCSIGGPLPDELYSLGLLESLFLNYNEFTGPISGQIRSLTNLKELYLFNNQLNGSIPEDIGGLENAEVISLGQNLLTGEIPYRLSFMPKLRVLSLEKEKAEVVAMFSVSPSGLRGELPDFGRAPNLRELYLGSNSLGGTIPPHFLAFANKSASIRVDLSHNALHSAVPAELAEFDDLRLFIGGNQISGIAPEVCDKKEWMSGLMATGCDAFLCPPGTYNEYGRRVVTEDCAVCDHRGMALAYGSTICSAMFPETLTEQDILGEFFDIAGGIEWTNKTNWRSEVSACSWFGVKCETVDRRETVTEISLPNNNLSDRVASIIFYLPSLRVLNVANNKVAVSLRDIGDAMSLQELDLTATEVVSLQGVSRARSLQVLKMGNNAFDGEAIPDELYSLSALRVLDISEDGFMGEISSLIGGLNKLEVLEANKNYLGGQIPDALGKLSLLTKLDLSNNMFYGDLPSSVQQLRKLEFLGIGARNQPSLGLSGILHSFSNLTNLIHLDLGGNLLTGTVPGDFLDGVTDTTAPITVLLDSNLLHGQLPPSLSRFTRLNLDITDNKIESIAPELCEMRFWNDGDVGRHDCDGLLCPAGTFNTAGRQDSEDNRCEDCPGQETDRYLGQSICPSLRKESAKIILKELFVSTGGESWKKKDGWMDDSDICAWHGIKCINDVDVEEINLGGNNLAGPVPKSVFELPSLKNLFLYSNPIQFSFDGIEKAASLMSLQLDSTGLSSLTGIGRAPILTYLDARFNALEGTLPDEIDQLIHLETLLLTENRLFGPLPTFESNRRLITVRLAENDFDGPLPSFAVHPSMRNLDVSNNQLNGPIPDDLFAAVESTTAIFLDLSGNQFSGTVPGSLSRFLDATIYIRDNQITGIPTEICKQERWNGGDVGRYSCDAILCPPFSFNPSTGRASDTNGDCQTCPQAPFYGHSQCAATASNGSSGAILVASRLFAAVMACSSAMALWLAIL